MIRQDPIYAKTLRVFVQVMCMRIRKVPPCEFNFDESLYAYIQILFNSLLSDRWLLNLLIIIAFEIHNSRPIFCFLLSGASTILSRALTECMLYNRFYRLLSRQRLLLGFCRVNRMKCRGFCRGGGAVVTIIIRLCVLIYSLRS